MPAVGAEQTAALERLPEPRQPNSAFRFSLREILLVIAVVACVTALWMQQSRTATQPLGNDKAVLHVDGPVRYRFWRQQGNHGSGNIWQNADGLDFFPNYVLVHASDRTGKLILMTDLTSFDWIRDDPVPPPSDSHAPHSH